MMDRRAALHLVASWVAAGSGVHADGADGAAGADDGGDSSCRSDGDENRTRATPVAQASSILNSPTLYIQPVLRILQVTPAASSSSIPFSPLSCFRA